MSKEIKFIIIGAGPCAIEMARIAKRLSDASGVVSIVEAANVIDSFASQMQKTIPIIKNFSETIVELTNPEYPKHKSKYFNKPQRNFKGKHIPLKRNNRNYY